MKINKIILSFVLLGWGGATSALSLNIRPVDGLKSGGITDGTLLAKGEISDNGDYCGFKIWSDAPLNNGRSQRYRLFSSGKQLNIRLSAPELIHDELNKISIIKSKNKTELFEIVSDGTQKISSASWEIILNGSVLKCQ